jgi:hypothetical protein
VWTLAGFDGGADTTRAIELSRVVAFKSLGRLPVVFAAQQIFNMVFLGEAGV